MVHALHPCGARVAASWRQWALHAWRQWLHTNNCPQEPAVFILLVVALRAPAAFPLDVEFPPHHAAGCPSVLIVYSSNIIWVINPNSESTMS